MKIDSHQHFWHYNTEEYGWMGGNMNVIKKDFLPNDLSIELNKIGFDGSIAVQSRQKLEETNWLIQLAEKYDIIKGVVGWVDLLSPSLKDQLEKYSEHPKFIGVRHVIHDEPDNDFILRNDFLKGISLLNEFNLVYDILVFPIHLGNTIKFVSDFPDQVFVLDHIAKPYIKDKKISPWKEQLEALATFPNIYCKISGMVTENNWDSWGKEDFYPYLDAVFEAFGTDRTMIGSDWPVCRVAGAYKEIMEIVIEYISKFSLKEQNNILGLNAIKAYKIKL